MALRILLQFGILFAIGFYLGPTKFVVGASKQPINADLSLYVKNPNDVIVVKGQSAHLKCDAFSIFGDKLNITWYHNGEQIITNNKTQQQYIINGTSLYIPKVINNKRNNNILLGDYNCLVQNKKGAILSNTAKLRIATIDRDFLIHPSNTTVNKMQPVVLHCNIHSTPIANIQWEYNNSPLPQNERFVPLSSGSLLITNVQQSDSGSYRCLATNSILKKPKLSKTAFLTVLPTNNGTSPTFLPLNEIENRTILVGEQLKLYCAVNGWPIPQIQWLNNDSVVIGNTTVLQINNISLNDSGNYTCTAYNNFGHINKMYTINVHQMPYFNITPSSKLYPPARTARLECQALGVPEPKIYWLKDGKPLIIKGRIKKQTNQIMFSHTFNSDSGIYQCVAVNSVGKIWSAAEIIMKNSIAPKPPENVHCRPYDDNSICLTWKFEMNSTVKAYTSYSFYNDGDKEVAGPDYLTNSTYQLANGLQTNTNYTFYIRSYSTAASDSSERVSCRTGTIGERNMRIHAVNESVLELKWSEISWDIPCNSTKRNYTLQWQRTDGKYIYGKNYLHTSKLKCILNGLLSGVEYKLRIISQSYDNNPNRWYVVKMPGIELTTPESLNVDSDLNIDEFNGTATSPTTVQLQWNNKNNIYNYFIICYNEYLSNDKCLEIKTSSTTYKINELKGNTMYEFKIKGYMVNDLSGTLYSRTIRIKTPDVPSPVIGLEYKIINNTSVCLRWQQPLHKNGNLTSYIISYTPDPNWLLIKWLELIIYVDKPINCWYSNNEQITALLTNLNINQNYTVLVRAKSNIGYGKPIVPIKVSTNPLYVNVNNNFNGQTPDYVQNDVNFKRKIGIYIGLSLAILCVICCLACTIVRKRCLKRRALMRARLAASNNYYPAVAHYAQHGTTVQVRLEDPCTAEMHEIQHLVTNTNDNQQHIPPIVAATHIDTKGGETFPNGHLNGLLKTHINGVIPNGNVNITENPQYHAYECNNGHIKRQVYEEDSNSNVKSTKFLDFYHIFDKKSKQIENNKKLNGDLVPNNNSSSTESLQSSSILNATQLTCLDDTLMAPINTNHRTISPILGPNG